MKRFLTFIAAALVSVASIGATLSPIQLLNPAGSTAGQAAVSTGPTTPPTWGGVAVTGIAPIGANTVLANGTGSTAAPTALAVPSCSASGSVLHWTSGTGFSCATSYALTTNALSQFASTTSAQLATVLSDETGTGVAVFATSPTITTPNIVGTTTNNLAAAGSVGEYPTPVSTTGTSMTTGTPANCAVMSLAAGDWDVQVTVQFNPGAATAGTLFDVGVGSASATLGAFGTFTQIVSAVSGTSARNVLISPVVRYSIASTTSVWAIGAASFSGGTMTCDGYIRARRVR